MFETRAVASLRAFGRVGIIVPKYRHGSVERNRLKRRMRELVRIELLPSLAALDIVIRALPRAYDRDFDALRAEVRRMSQTLARMRPADPATDPTTGSATPDPIADTN